MNRFIASLVRAFGLKTARRWVDKGVAFDRHVIEAHGVWAEQTLELELAYVDQIEAERREDRAGR